MLDVNILRNNPEIIKANLKKRDLPDLLLLVDKAIDLDINWRALKKKEENLRKERNILAKKINTITVKSEKDNLIRKAKRISDEISELTKKTNLLKEELDSILFNLPNILDETVPPGKSAADNKTIRFFGVKPTFSFKPRNHIELLELLDMADFEKASKISGARFYFLKNYGVLLDNALQAFALDFLQKKGFMLIRPPELMNKRSLETAISFADFKDVIYKIEGEDLYLIGTAEHPLTAMHYNEIFSKKDFPLMYAGISSCFRKEAGSHGIDTKGIYRVHEFRKIEQYVFCVPEDAKKYHEMLLSNAEEIFQLLGIHYRIVDVCSADIGMIASKKYDLEAWLPATNSYGEMVSCSNCTDYQARRAKIRFVDEKGKISFVYTLNSTAIATTRAIVAILENYQREDGSVEIPKVLRPYLGNLKEIFPSKEKS